MGWGGFRISEMKNSSLTIFGILVAILAVAGWGGWVLATRGSGSKVGGAKPGVTESANQVAPMAVSQMDPKHPLAAIMDKDPVQTYMAGKTAEERYDILSNFMALGHESNYAMLKAALRDADPENRIYAVESASALEIPEAVDVFKEGAASTDPDVREMTWSLSATYPMESRAAIYREALVRGPGDAFTEALDEMGVTPERPLFEMMLAVHSEMSADRLPKILDTLREWLEPGGGEVPRFGSVADVAKWWERQEENYDEYMLRVDLDE